MTSYKTQDTKSSMFMWLIEKNDFSITQKFSFYEECIVSSNSDSDAYFIKCLETKSTGHWHKCYTHKISRKMSEDITDPVHHKKYSFASVNAVIAKNWKWIVIKPVLIFYCFQLAIIQAVTSQVICMLLPW